MLLCGIALGLVVAPTRADEAVDKVPALIEKHHGTAERAETRPGRPVVAATVFGLTDADLKTLAGCESLSALTVQQSSVTDAGAKELAALKSLTFLDVVTAGVTNAGRDALRKALPKCAVPDPRRMFPF